MYLVNLISLEQKDKTAFKIKIHCLHQKPPKQPPCGQNFQNNPEIPQTTLHATPSLSSGRGFGGTAGGLEGCQTHSHGVDRPGPPHAPNSWKS